MKSDLEITLALIELRQKAEEDHRDAALLKKKYGEAYGFESISVGLMIAANIVKNEIFLQQQEQK